MHLHPIGRDKMAQDEKPTYMLHLKTNQRAFSMYSSRCHRPQNIMADIQRYCIFYFPHQKNQHTLALLGYERHSLRFHDSYFRGNWTWLCKQWDTFCFVQHLVGQLVPMKLSISVCPLPDPLFSQDASSATRSTQEADCVNFSELILTGPVI